MSCLPLLMAALLSVFCQGLMWLQDSITPAWVANDNAAVYVVAARKS